MEDKSNFKEELNRIYSKPQALRNFWNSKLTYNMPLAYMLESYNTNPKEFSELFPLKVGDNVWVEQDDGTTIEKILQVVELEDDIGIIEYEKD